MRENFLYYALIALIFFGLYSSTLTGEAPRQAIVDRDTKLRGAGYDVVGEREYLISRGLRTDTLGSPGRAGYSVFFDNFPFPPGKGDLDRNGQIDRNDLIILQQIYQRAIDQRTPLQKHGVRWEFPPTRTVVTSDIGFGIYDSNGDIDDDGQITMEDVEVLRRALNPYMSVRTSIMTEYKDKADCVELGAQTCTAGQRWKIGTCREIRKGGALYGLLAYQWEDCPRGSVCVVRGRGKAECAFTYTGNY